MHYHEFKPDLPLSNYVQLIWMMESESGEDHFPRERILPDGIVEVVFHYRDPFTTRRADGTCYQQPAAFAISQMREFIEIESVGDIGFVAVRFFPWGAYHFFRKPVKEFLDDVADVDEIWPIDGPAINRKLSESDVGTRKDLVESFLLTQLNRFEREDKIVDKGVRLIRDSGGRMTIRQVCDELGLGDRQLQRKFLAAVGTSPKVFSRVSRFLHLCHHLTEYRSKSLTDLTFECGFFDQAHFIKEFRQFSGFTPGQFFDQHNVGFADLE